MFDVVCWLYVEKQGLQPKWDVVDVLLWDVIGVSASGSISEVTKLDPTAETACVLITVVAIVNRSPSSETVGSKLALPASACKCMLRPSSSEIEGNSFCISPGACLSQLPLRSLFTPDTAICTNCHWEFPRLWNLEKRK